MRLSKEARTLFNAKRFAIAAYLYGRRWATMAEIRKATGLTWGDLDSNIRTMQKHGLVTTRRALTREGPRTLVSLTSKGLEAFEELLIYLERNIKNIKNKQDNR